MKRKNYLSILLALTLLLSLTLCAGAEAFADGAAATPKDQLKLIASQFTVLEQNDSMNTWYYTVADLDHECPLAKDAGESFPDIMTDTVDTYHVKDTDTWYYMVYDNIVISDSEVYTVKTAVNLKNDMISYQAYAVEHTILQNGARTVSHTDANGFVISDAQYNASGTDAFAGAERSNTAFEWLTADSFWAPENRRRLSRSRSLWHWEGQENRLLLHRLLCL